MRVFGLSRTRRGTPVDITDRVRRVAEPWVTRIDGIIHHGTQEEVERLIAERNVDGRHPIG